MTLDEWTKLDEEGRSKVLVEDRNAYLAIAQEAARAFLDAGHLKASSVYLVDRFGELMLLVYVPDSEYDSFGGGWGHVVEEFRGFRFTAEPERQMYPGLQAYAGEYFFARYA